MEGFVGERGSCDCGDSSSYWEIGDLFWFVSIFSIGGGILFVV